MGIDGRGFPRAPRRSRRATILRCQLQASGRGPQADRLLLSGEAGQPDEEDLPYLARVFGAPIEVMQLGNNDMRLTYGEGVALLGVERRLSDDEAGHSSWHYIVRFCRRAVADTEGDGEGTDGGEVGAETPPGGSSLPINTEDGDDGAGGGDDGTETPIGGSSAPMNEQPPIRRRLTSKTPRAATVYPETPSASAAAASSDRPLPYHDAAAEIMRENSAIGERQLLSALQERGFAISRASAREWLRSYKQSAACDDSLTARRKEALLPLLVEKPDLSAREAGRLLRARGISMRDAELRPMLQDLRPRDDSDSGRIEQVLSSMLADTPNLTHREAARLRHQ